MKKFKIVSTKKFNKWFNNLPDVVITRILRRLDRVSEGNFGDYKWFGEFGELRFKFDKGYRIYFTHKGQKIILLLLGGDKSSQGEDFKTVRAMLKEIKKNEEK